MHLLTWDVQFGVPLLDTVINTYVMHTVEFHSYDSIKFVHLAPKMEQFPIFTFSAGQIFWNILFCFCF